MNLGWTGIEIFLGPTLDGSVSHMTTNDLANTLWSLGSKRIQLSALQPSTKSSLLRRYSELVGDMDSYEHSWSLWALARMDLNWSSEFSFDLKTKIVVALEEKAVYMAQQEIGVLLWALIKLQVNKYGCIYEVLLYIITYVSYNSRLLFRFRFRSTQMDLRPFSLRKSRIFYSGRVDTSLLLSDQINNRILAYKYKVIIQYIG
jgi:hypothetical protein